MKQIREAIEGLRTLILSKDNSEKIPVNAHKVDEERTGNDCLLKVKQAKDKRDKKNDTKESTNKKELITDYVSQMKNTVAIQERSLKGKQFIINCFKPVNSKSTDQEPKETVKEIKRFGTKTKETRR